MDIHRSRATALRTESLMDFPDLILDSGVRKLARDSKQRSASLAVLVTEASVSVALTAENDGRAAIVALRHIVVSLVRSLCEETKFSSSTDELPLGRADVTVTRLHVA